MPSILSAATGVAATASVLYSVSNAMLELKYRKICDEAMGDFAKRKEVQAFKRKGKKVFSSYFLSSNVMEGCWLHRVTPISK